MNDWDKNNLEFLLSLKTEEDWDDWFNATDEDDHVYAMELLKRAQSEVTVKAMEIVESFTDEEKFPEVQNILKRFML